MSKRYPVVPPATVGEVYQETCRHCGGNGQEPGFDDLTCRECIGRGRRKWRIEECSDCGGRGYPLKTLGLFKCKSCGGHGWLALDVG